MTNTRLARAYLDKCRIRMKVLSLLYAEGAWSDVVREAQELVELALRGMLRQLGVDPPKVHELSAVLRAHAARFPPDVDVEALAHASKELRRDRELSFYGAEDVIPTEFYTRDHADAAMAHARRALQAAEIVIAPLPEGA